jgi:hypothetical protein
MMGRNHAVQLFFCCFFRSMLLSCTARLVMDWMVYGRTLVYKNGSCLTNSFFIFLSLGLRSCIPKMSLISNQGIIVFFTLHCYCYLCLECINLWLICLNKKRIWNLFWDLLISIVLSDCLYESLGFIFCYFMNCDLLLVWILILSFELDWESFDVVEVMFRVVFYRSRVVEIDVVVFGVVIGVEGWKSTIFL